jgi:OOP family OmpA-OmpF porin
MASSLVMGLTDLFKSQALGTVAAQSGESESSVLRGFEASIQTMIASLGSKVGQTGLMRSFFDLISSPTNDTGVLDNVRSLASNAPDPRSGGLGSRFMSLLFGGEQSAVTEAIGRASGVRPGTASSLMAMAAPLLLGTLGRRIREGNLDFDRMTSLLSKESAGLKEMLPSGVRNLIGFDGAPREVRTAAVTAQERSRGWLWPVLAAVAILAGLLWLWNNRRAAEVTGASVLDTANRATTAAANFLTRTLPGSISLRIPQGGMEDRLVSFIQGPVQPAESNSWFDFDRLQFDSGSATLRPESQEQLRNIAEILRAYPPVHLKIGGYTDNSGDPAANLQLSQQRAEAVKQNLIGLGVSADRLESEGYGDQYPVGDNSTEEGRQKNRRIALRVTQK